MMDWILFLGLAVIAFVVFFRLLGWAAKEDRKGTLNQQFRDAVAFWDKDPDE